MKRGEGKTQEEKFWSRVDKSGDCWLWTGSLNHCGYGSCSIKILGKRRSLAHRIAFYFAFGVDAFQYKLLICHKCDTPNCVRPEHLFMATQSENMRDMVEKKRACKGEQRQNSKLTTEKVKEIRRIYAEQEISYNELGRQFGVGPSVIRSIVLRQRWAHVE